MITKPPLPKPSDCPPPPAKGEIVEWVDGFIPDEYEEGEKMTTERLVRESRLFQLMEEKMVPNESDFEFLVGFFSDAELERAIAELERRESE